MESVYNVAGIDVHKKILAVVIANAHDRELQFECRKFGTTLSTTVSELRPLVDWLQVQSVQEAAMEWTLPIDCAVLEVGPMYRLFPGRPKGMSM